MPTGAVLRSPIRGLGNGLGNARGPARAGGCADDAAAGLSLGRESRYARCDLLIPSALACQLGAHVADRDEAEVAFRPTVETILDRDNVGERVRTLACAQAGVEWGGFDTFRHNVVSARC